MAQAKAKSNSVVTTQWSGDILGITVLGAGQLLFDRTKASEANRDLAEKHGWTQRLCDRMAKGRDAKTGLSASPKLKFDAVAGIIAYYESGDVPWKMSGGGSEGGMIFEALCEFYAGKKSAEQVRKFLDTRTDEQMKVVRKVPELIEIMNRLRLERAKTVDIGDALGDLDAMGDEGEGAELDQEISDLMTDE
jgi:hypothetical protein